MKDLKKLAVILRALGITANVVSEQNEFTTLLECSDLKDCYIKEN